MGLKLNSLKKFGIPYILATSLALNPLYANAQDKTKKIPSKKQTIETYLKNKITELEKDGDEKEALKTNYLLENIIKSKKNIKNQI